MNKNRKSAGFSLAEMMIVVAIIVILAGVSFVGVQRYQRSSTRLEFDTVAKEIFFAAQNHLTEAEGQGLLKNLAEAEYGYPGTLDADKLDSKQEVYYVLNDASSEKVRSLMLPQYAIEGSVLAGSYLIRYQPSTGRVLDVFFSRPGTPTFLTSAGTTLGGEGYSYSDLMNSCKGDGNSTTRESFGSANAVIGWYGGEEAVRTGVRLSPATFKIRNEEILEVMVKDANTARPEDYKIKLLITGKTSGAEKAIDLTSDSLNGRVSISDGAYHIVLDDITKANMHFANLDESGPEDDFIPGEDIEVKVVCFRTRTLANVAMTTVKTTNSLFAEPNTVMKNGTDIANETVAIANFRHLENLDGRISGLGKNSRNGKSIAVASALQTADLDWVDFQRKTNANKVFYKDGPASVENCCLPVSPQNHESKAYALSYNGQGHKVTNVKVRFDGTAGLFGTLTLGCIVKNLELIDFSVKGTLSAGALAGLASGCQVTNVIARNTDNSAASLALTITATDGEDGPLGDLANGTVIPPTAGLLNFGVFSMTYAGGLIGKMEGTTLTCCAASVLVGGGSNLTTYAGGLVGSADGTSKIKSCYAGGHTKNGSYEAWVAEHRLYDVTAAIAGGLAGTSSAEITYSYTTCSVSGATAGGFAGEASGNIENCYCTGLVNGTTIKYAFLGTEVTPLSLSDNYYYQVINRDDESQAILPVSGYELSTYTDKIRPLDLTAKSYNDFVGAFDNWNPAAVYDAALSTYYSDRYPLKAVSRLNPSMPNGYSAWKDLYVYTHYGDWPSPEVFFINE